MKLPNFESKQWNVVANGQLISVSIVPDPTLASMLTARLRWILANTCTARIEIDRRDAMWAVMDFLNKLGYDSIVKAWSDINIKYGGKQDEAPIL